MRKSMILFAALVPIAGLAGASIFALPAMADADDDVCVGTSMTDQGPIDLEAIPQQPVTGPLSVRGAGDDCDEMEEDDDEHVSGLADDDDHREDDEDEDHDDD